MIQVGLDSGRTVWVHAGGPQRVQEGLEWGYLKEDGPTVEEQGEGRECLSAESLI